MIFFRQIASGGFWLQRPEQFGEVVGGEAGGFAVARAAVDGVGERLLFLLQGEDAVFDGVFGDEFVDEDGLFLADAVGAVGGLVFDGGVPPGVVVDDGVGGGEVEADAAGLEADEEDGDVAVLEAGDGGFAVAGLAGEFAVGDVAGLEFGFDEAERGGELREQQDAPAFFDEFGEHGHQGFELGAGGDLAGAGRSSTGAV